MDETANGRLILWKLGSNPDIGYCAGSQEFANDVLALMKEANQLRAELAKEREKVALKEKQISQLLSEVIYEVSTPRIRELEEQLAAAQATIEQMGYGLETLISAANESYGMRYGTLSAWWVRDVSETAISLPANLNLLHELRALECERLAESASEFSDRSYAAWLRVEAAAHRAKKGEGK